jgi:hypothetical protein
MLVWLNGRVVDARAARVSVLDRGLLHGDGAYDTWRTYGGRPFALAAHLARLAHATRRLERHRPARPARGRRAPVSCYVETGSPTAQSPDDHARRRGTDRAGSARVRRFF